MKRSPATAELHPVIFRNHKTYGTDYDTDEPIQITPTMMAMIMVNIIMTTIVRMAENKTKTKKYEKDKERNQ